MGFFAPFRWNRDEWNKEKVEQSRETGLARVERREAKKEQKATN